VTHASIMWGSLVPQGPTQNADWGPKVSRNKGPAPALVVRRKQRAGEAIPGSTEAGGEEKLVTFRFRHADTLSGGSRFVRFRDTPDLRVLLRS
jgi:hypothetical protein